MINYVNMQSDDTEWTHADTQWHGGRLFSFPFSSPFYSWLRESQRMHQKEQLCSGEAACADEVAAQGVFVTPGSGLPGDRLK